MTKFQYNTSMGRSRDRLSRRLVTNVPVVTKKKERATSEQLQFFLDYCVKHPKLLQKKKKRNMEHIDESWTELTEQLNLLKGPTRTAKQWKNALYHWKDQVVSRVRKSQTINVNTSLTHPELSLKKSDRKAIEVFGLNIDELLQNSSENQMMLDYNNSSSENECDIKFSIENSAHDSTFPNCNIKNKPQTPRSSRSSSSELHVQVESPMSLNQSEKSKSFTEKIFAKLSDIDANLIVFNRNLERIANIMEKIANKY